MSASPSDVGHDRRRDNIVRGILLTLGGIFLFATQDAAQKFLVQSYSPFQITMMRFWASFAFSFAIMVRQGEIRGAFRSGSPILQVLRPIFLVVDIWLFSFALQTISLAELQAILLIYPLIVTLVAIPLLKEKVGIFRMVAVCVGFLGALVIVRPGGVPFDFGVFCAIGAAVTYALYIVLTRKVSETDSTATSMFYVGVIGLIMTSAVGIFFWQPPDAASWALILYIMVTGCVSHAMIIAALGMAPASVLQPFNYTSLPWGILLGYVLFGQMIDPISLMGAIVIIAAGLVVMARERIKKIRPVTNPPLPGKD
ncbi:drug/metabolite transporter (DMT)-like permease [Rhodoligotrophos appendicifer]|uniref:DMT family transporter n=1 Tax=Rhodoligotrophos appendicifer TaxID=987056 RepID=UPI00117BF2AB|nr:DMT family transporter [Rhodoligotrophos appendicifer]